MSRNTDPVEWRVATDRERIVDWAAAHDAVPVRVDRADDPTGLALVTDPGDSPGEPIDWEEFFARFEEERLALHYRPRRPDGGDPAWDLVDLGTVLDPDAGGEVVSETIATGDTGEAAPVAFDEVDEAPDKPDRAVEADPEEPKPEEPADHDTSMAESAHGAEAAALVLDEISEHSGPFDSGPVEEYLVFENDGDVPLDLSGWTVENDAGRSYTVPEGVTLDPGEQVTLHSGDGTDAETDLYWGADEPVWDDDGDTVTVTTAAGDRVLREPYKRG